MPLSKKNISSSPVYVIGVGMTKFEKPGKRDWDYPDMAKIAVERALQDAQISYEDIEQACVGYCYGDSTCGQRALYPLGMTGIPIYNINNNCATGSSALYLAKQLVAGNQSQCVLALGFEKMERGSLQSKYSDRTNPLDQHVERLNDLYDYAGGPMAPWMFASAGLECMKKYGINETHYAQIAEKNHNHSVNNPYSQFHDTYTTNEILNSKMVSPPLTKLQCCPTSDGSAAIILATKEFVQLHHLEHQAIEIIGMGMSTDPQTSFHEPSITKSKSAMKLIGLDMTKKAAKQAYELAQCQPEDIDVIELHDCFSTNECITYLGLGICNETNLASFIDQKLNTYGGNVVINPSGGLLSKGHPLGATGLAQCCEICWQLRHQAEKRQVLNAKLGLTHNLGLGGAAIVTIYQKYSPRSSL